MTEEVRFYILVAWMLVWKGMALWKCARASQKIWFVLIFAFPFNTFGVLEILYIFVISKVQEQGLSVYIQSHLPWAALIISRSFPKVFAPISKSSKKH